MINILNQYKILNSKEIKEIIKIIEEHYGIKNLKLHYGFLKNNQNKLFLVDRDFSNIDLKDLRINSIGLYFGEHRNDTMRLSIEGSQIIGKFATKNIAEINETELNDWVTGKDIVYGEANLGGFILIKNNNDFLGCGRYKDGIIFNYISKDRRIKALTGLTDTE